MADGGPFNFGFLEQFGVPLTRVAAGEVLFRQGDKADRMYLVLDGKIEIRLGETVLETVGLHGIVGEMALLDTSSRSATAAAITAGEVAIIDRQTFLDLVRENPSFSLYVMHRMAGRIRHMNDNLQL
jgi:CRP/FNR family transcriptional regulator, cyclic AMP receptor protein